ncbi:sensor histidine kinase [Streptomyces sp. NBC_01304]|uniref:sensor histidine kinase n=1 Tax=Streptomyces sp. NBC_01304 TaxID=2903818 RepID=UPI002E136867|nr:sensor histidine kinase [Streptomyces sp. NBC_01304]
MNAPPAAPRPPLWPPRFSGPTRFSRPATGELLAWCGALAYPFALYFAALSEQQELTGIRLVPAALTAVLPFALLRYRPLPALVLMLAGSFAVVTLVTEPEAPWPARGQGQGWQIGYLQAVVVDIAVGWIAATRPRRTAVTAGVMALVVQILSTAYYRSGSDVFASTALSLVLALATAWLIGFSVYERSRHAETLRAQAALQAVTAERLRIARELHDMVAHSIGVIAIQAGVGSRVIETQPAEARNALSAIETTSRETLAGLRRMLVALRQSDEGKGAAPVAPAPGLADVDRLAETVRDAGVRVDVEWRGERRALPAEVELSAFRIIQEAVTNVVRHAGVTGCRVVVEYPGDAGPAQEEALSIEIVDDGTGPVLPGAGYGIIGMRERAGLLGGALTAGPRPEGGFRVAARLPVPEETR